MQGRNPRNPDSFCWNPDPMQSRSNGRLGSLSDQVRDNQEWRDEGLCEVTGGGTGLCGRADAEFVQSLDRAQHDPPQHDMFDIVLDAPARSAGMRRVAGRLVDRLAAQPES